MIVWELLHPKMTVDYLGFIPDFLSENDPRSAREQFDANYIAGWRPSRGFRMDLTTGRLVYPGDPDMYPVARTRFREETILFYPHAYVAVIQPDKTWEVCRMD